MSHAPCFRFKPFLKKRVAVLGNLTVNGFSNLHHLGKKTSGNPEIRFAELWHKVCPVLKELYHSHRIRVLMELNREADCWIPKAEVSWDEDGELRHQVLTGPVTFFKIIDEADRCAVEMAKDWIDSLVRKKPIPYSGQ